MDKVGGTSLFAWRCSRILQDFSTGTKKVMNFDLSPVHLHARGFCLPGRQICVYIGLDMRAHTHRRRDSTRQLRRVGVGGVYWA